jgi:hypothetical protein
VVTAKKHPVQISVDSSKRLAPRASLLPSTVFRG